MPQALDAEAGRCAARLGLAHARRMTGYGDLATALAGLQGWTIEPMDQTDVPPAPEEPEDAEAPLDGGLSA